ncbi:hypothetical protein [Fulvimarina sp. MAC8]|uniref:hypothetical protein n=1 Tax=Fulvimarina sp. MAC8 TaxID=3162874 RepID=UPI0032EC2622
MRTRTLFIRAIGAVALSAAVAMPSNANAQNTFQGCGWYAIFACSKSQSVARRAAGNGFLTIRTNDYPNFRNGFWCAVDGPFDRGTALSLANSAKRDGIRDAYAKRGC